MGIAENAAAVRERISVAARRVGRSVDDVVLMGVSKTFPAEAVREAYAAGIRVFGENRVQEFAEKSAQLGGGLAGAEFHLIGHLQSNKAGRAAELFDAVDSVDSLRLAERLDAAAGGLGKILRVLVEINIGGEEAKAGLRADSAELEGLLLGAARLSHLGICGLMAIPPFFDDAESARPYFRRLRGLRDAIAGRGISGVGMGVLSMGMSHDFEVAVEEGSTCVRVGTGIFGVRG